MRAAYIAGILTLLICFSLLPVRSDEKDRPGLEALGTGKGKKYDLKPGFTPGRTRTVAVTRELGDNMGSASHEVEQKTYMTQTAETAEGGGVRFKRTFDRIALKICRNGLTILNCDTSSKEKPTDEAGILLTGVPGKSLIIYLDNSAGVKKIEGQEEIYDAMVDAYIKEKFGKSGNPSAMKDGEKNISDEIRESLKSSLKSTFKFEDFAEDISDAKTIIPGRKFAVGAKWRQPHKIRFPDFSGINASLTTEFTKIEGNEAILVQAIEVPANTSATYQTVMPMSVELINGSKTVRFDLEKKELVILTRELHLKFTGTAPNGQKLSIERKTKEVFDFTPKKKPDDKETPAPAPPEKEKSENVKKKE